MSDHMHIYTTKGRCIGTRAIGDRTISREIEATIAARLQFDLISQGMTLKLWNANARAGLLRSKDQSFIVRIKPTGVAKNMLAAGVAQTMREICIGGAEVEPFTGLLAAA